MPHAPVRIAAVLACAFLAGCAALSTETRYAALLRSYEAAGLLRVDPAPPDAPFGNADLVRNFERIAFFSEFAPIEPGGDGALRIETTPSALFKWAGPVRWKLEGDGATPQDLASYRELTGRLASVTGLDFVETDERPDMFIFFASRPLRDAFAEMLEARGARDRMRLIREWADNDLYPCVGQVGASGEGAARRSQAIIAVKAETSGRLREGCIHEELVQALGLINDHPDVRPSIFNDDQEFATLTRHDEYLLRILYDPRLESGMTAEEGMPIVREIVAEIGPGAPSAAPPLPPAPPTAASRR